MNESKAVVKNGVLFIPYKGKTNKAVLRVFDKDGNQSCYRSSRLGTLKQDKDGFTASGIEGLNDCRIEIKDLESKKTILEVKPSFEVVNGK